MINKTNWAETKRRWGDYWARANGGPPLLSAIARRAETEATYQAAMADGKKLYEAVCQGTDATLPDELMYTGLEDKYQNAGRMAARYRHFCQTHDFLADSFPNINVDFGPGSVAAYLGCDITWHDDTVWFEPSVADWAGAPPLAFDPENPWWKKHLELVRQVSELAGDDFLVGLPDLMENIDILASLRGAQDTVFDLMDEPEEVAERIGQVGQAYFEYYDRMHELVAREGGNAYTVFQIWGAGRTAKLQCDFSAMLGPGQFREFIQPALRSQAQRLDNVLYHLDGPDSIRHLPALMEIEEIDALQWTSGDHGPDGTHPDWYPIYDAARAAGKSIWVKVYSGTFEDWLASTGRMVQRYGSRGTFFMFPELSAQQAEVLLDTAHTKWSDVPGERGV